jgi:alcohol dehydrogenase YqhD (iron-dependent ADH family)
MENFEIYNPTHLFFGKNTISNLDREVKKFGKKALLVYGKGSIKKNGIYDDVTSQLKESDIKYIEYSGVKPNPEISDVIGIAQLGRKEKADMLIAVGGGSVIDSAKIASLCIKEKHDPWEVMKYKAEPKTSVPLIAILTLAGTGTEMNPFAVSQNPETREKIGFANPFMYPKFSFLDPCYTYSVNAEYTAYGIVDLIAHTLEAFFGHGLASLSDKFVVAIIKDAMETAETVLSEPENYEARASMMWQATCALNGLPAFGRKSPDWGVHDIGHTLSFLYDTPHGASLSISYPAWLRLQESKIAPRISELGKALFGTDSAEKCILELENFFKSIKSPIRLQDIGIEPGKEDEIVSLMTKNKVNGANHKLTDPDYEKIVEFMVK